MPKKAARSKSASKTRKGTKRAPAHGRGKQQQRRASASDWKPETDSVRLWKENQADTGFETPDIPNGTYIVRISDAQMGKTDKGRDYMRIGMVIDRGECQGLQPTCWLHLNNDPGGVGVRIFKQNLEILGFDTEKLSPDELPDVAERISGLADLLRVRIRNRSTEQGDFQDVRILGILEGEKDEIPF